MILEWMAVLKSERQALIRAGFCEAGWLAGLTEPGSEACPAEHVMQTFGKRRKMLAP